MGNTERTIRTSRQHIITTKRPKKAIPTAIKTLGDYLLVKRYEKGLLQSHVAQIVEVPILTVKRWEEDLQRPSKAQWTALTKVLELEQEAWKP